MEFCLFWSFRIRSFIRLAVPPLAVGVKVEDDDDDDDRPTNRPTGEDVAMMRTGRPTGTGIGGHRHSGFSRFFMWETVRWEVVEAPPPACRVLPMKAWGNKWKDKFLIKYSCLGGASPRRLTALFFQLVFISVKIKPRKWFAVCEIVRNLRCVECFPLGLGTSERSSVRWAV